MASILMKNYGSKPTFAGAGGMDFGTSSSMDSFGTSTFGNDTFGSGTTDSTFGSTSTGVNIDLFTSVHVSLYSICVLCTKVTMHGVPPGRSI